MAGIQKLRRDMSRPQPEGLFARRFHWLLASTCLAGTCFVVSPAVAANWLGTVSADWFTAGNWNPAAVPGSATAVTINNAGTPNPSTINAPGAVAGRVDLGSAGGQSGTLNVAGGTLAATSLFAGILGTGTVNITNGGLLSTTGTARPPTAPIRRVRSPRQAPTRDSIRARCSSPPMRTPTVRSTLRMAHRSRRAGRPSATLPPPPPAPSPSPMPP